MNSVAVFGILAMIASASWNVHCLPQFRTERVFTTSTNGGPPTTYRETNNNGQRGFSINGRDVDGWGSNNPFGRGTQFGRGNPFENDMFMGNGMGMGNGMDMGMGNGMDMGMNNRGMGFGSPQFQSRRTIYRSSNGGPGTTYTEINNNGDISRTMNGQPVEEWGTNTGMGGQGEDMGNMRMGRRNNQ